MKPVLLILEGPDRVSKDTILKQNLNNITPYIPIKDSPPDYRNEQIDFVKCLNIFLKREIDELPAVFELCNNNIMMGRLFTSEYVYSSLFNRINLFKTSEHKNDFNELSKIFDIRQLILLYHSYKQYLNRCKSSNSKIEYSEEEFSKTQNLYLYSPYNEISNTTIMFTKDNTIDNITNFIKNSITKYSIL